MITAGPGIVRFHAINMGELTVSAGGAGWVDTDVSATTGTDTTKLWVIRSYQGAGQVNGARAHGEPTQAYSYAPGTLLSYVDMNGHMDLWRGGGDATYTFVGYLQ